MAKRGPWKSGICAASGIALLAAIRVAVGVGELHIAIGIPLMEMGMAVAVGGFKYFSRVDVDRGRHGIYRCQPVANCDRFPE